MVVYQIENKINNKVYIGQTIRPLNQRFVEHAQGDLYIGRALRKYGLENFNICVIDKAETREELNKKEIYWIKTLDCKFPNGYNLTDGGDGVIDSSGLVGQKISKKLKGRKFPGRLNPGTWKEGRDSWNSGKQCSEEHCKNLSESHKGKIQSEETKRKRSESLKAAYKNGTRKSWNLGISQTEDSRKKNSESHKKKVIEEDK